MVTKKRLGLEKNVDSDMWAGKSGETLIFSRRKDSVCCMSKARHEQYEWGQTTHGREKEPSPLREHVNLSCERRKIRLGTIYAPENLKVYLRVYKSNGKNLGFLCFIIAGISHVRVDQKSLNERVREREGEREREDIFTSTPDDMT